MLDEKRVNHENARNNTKQNREFRGSYFVYFRVVSWFRSLLSSMKRPLKKVKRCWKGKSGSLALNTELLRLQPELSAHFSDISNFSGFAIG